MSDRPDALSPATGNAAGSVSATTEKTVATATAAATASMQRLRLNPNKEHKPDEYDDLPLEFSPAIFSSLEKYLPPSMLNAPRDDKANFMRDVLNKYMPPDELSKNLKLRAYRQRIMANYKPRHRELYAMNPTTFFVPAFLKAINENTEQSFRKIMNEPSPGIFTFEMLQPRLCQLFLSELENIEKFVTETKIRIMRPNLLNKHGFVLDDFGFGSMLDKLMEGFIRPLSRVFYAEVGLLDSHHGFVVQYGQDKAIDMGFHVDDSEVSLNVCLGKQFSGGDLFFRGTRCENHVNSETYPEEVFEYPHVPGRAVLHRGRHRRGTRAIVSGHRVNLVLWCRSSSFREMKMYQSDFSSWCGKCNREKKERQHSSIAASRSELFRKEGEPTP